MFVRIVKTKSGKKTHRYLRVVESYRSNGRVRQRVLWNMGKWERVRPGLSGLVRSLSRFSGEQFLTVREIKDRQVKEYGNVLLLQHLWETSGFRKALESNLRAGTAPIMAMVFHRLCQPATSLRNWLKRVYLPDAEKLTKLGEGRLRRRLLNGINSLSKQGLSLNRNQKVLSASKSCVIKISPLSAKGKGYRGNYLATLPLGHNNLPQCKVYTGKELRTLLKEQRGPKGALIAWYSTLGREGVAFLDKEFIPYLAFLKGRAARRRSRKRYFTFSYGNQRVCIRTNIARKISPYKAKRAFKGLLETEASIGHPILAPFVPPVKTYLKGYILLCILAYLLNRRLRERLHSHGIRLQPAEALDTLKELRFVSNLSAGRKWDYLTGITRERLTLLKAFGVKKPRL
jgi:hypothetical protein